MGSSLVLLLTSFLLGFNTLAVVEVYERQQIHHKSQCLDFFDPQFTYLKSYRGIRRSIGGRDPVDRPPQALTPKDFIEQVSSGLGTVRKVYEETFRKMDWSEEKIRDQIRIFEDEDTARLNESQNAEPSIYFVSRGRDGDVGVLRAIMVKASSNGHLPIESKLHLEPGNRVELGRAYIASDSRSGIILREILQEASLAFSNFFEGQEYQVTGLTDRPRAKRYKSWGFESKQISTIENTNENFFVFQSGHDFYYRYSETRCRYRFCSVKNLGEYEDLKSNCLEV